MSSQNLILYHFNIVIIICQSHLVHTVIYMLNLSCFQVVFHLKLTKVLLFFKKKMTILVESLMCCSLGFLIKFIHVVGLIKEKKNSNLINATT